MGKDDDFSFPKQEFPFTSAMTVAKEMQTWQRILADSITKTEDLPPWLEVESASIRQVIARYPMRVNPYYLRLIRRRGDAIYKQCIPDPRELADEAGTEDPLNEEGLSPVQGVIHRYPDRVAFLVSSTCAVYCRFCNRKRKVGRPGTINEASIGEGIAYIRSNSQIRDVLLSGGDPLLLSDRKLQGLLAELRSIPHVEILRIGTRVPCTLPQRITPRLVSMLKKFHPLYLHTHFNHPEEITSEAAAACGALADAGIPLGCQTVLLKGVNDSPHTMKLLMQKLLTIRVRPYYLFQADLVRGTSHFWTPLSKGMEIMAALQGHTSGLCVPHFAIDLPGGGGKVPLLPEYAVRVAGDCLVVKNYRGEVHQVPFRGGWKKTC